MEIPSVDFIHLLTIGPLVRVSPAIPVQLMLLVINV